MPKPHARSRRAGLAEWKCSCPFRISCPAGRDRRRKVHPVWEAEKVFPRGEQKGKEERTPRGQEIARRVFPANGHSTTGRFLRAPPLLSAYHQRFPAAERTATVVTSDPG